jgi:hypothetical protein
MSNGLNDDNFEDLDDIFTLPDYIEDDTLRTAYEVIVNRLRREARHVPMTTIQQLLIERIAVNYIVLRHNENEQEFAHTTAQKDFNSFWLSMTHEFNSLVKITDADYREQLLKQVGKVIRDSLIEDYPEQAAGIQERLKDEFARQGY